MISPNMLGARAFRGGFFMPLLDIMRSKRLWIGLGAAALALLVMCALGALLVVKGILRQESQMGWICAGYVVSGLLGTWVAARGEKGTLLRAVILALLMVLVAWVVSLTCSNGLNFAEGGWKLLLAILAGCLAAGIMTGGGKSGKRRHRRASSAGHRRSVR